MSFMRERSFYNIIMCPLFLDRLLSEVPLYLTHGWLYYTDMISHLHLLLLVHRCGDTHRELLRSKDYVQVSLQRGLDRMTVTCPRSMQGELRRCINNKQEQGYTMLSLTEESI